MKLSLLICGLENRLEIRNKLYKQIEAQHNEALVEVITELDNGEMEIGDKRNKLLDRAVGEYVAFIDDDDELSSHYIDELLNAIKMKPDCCSLRGIITTDGKDGQIFEHSIKYTAYKTNPPTDGIRYVRFPNHLNCIKATIAKQFKFPSISHGEDTDWATQIYTSGLLKDEAYISDVIYHYNYISKK